MCQMHIVLERGGRQEKILENATSLEATPEGWRIATLFEEPQLVRARLRKIDFLTGTVLLAADQEEEPHG